MREGQRDSQLEVKVSNAERVARVMDPKKQIYGLD